MKQFKNAVAVVIAAAGLVSVSAMAGTAVHWAGSDAGNAKDVKWQVVQPSRLDFNITTADVQSVRSDGFVNCPAGQSRACAGTWRNGGQTVTVTTPDRYDNNSATASGGVGSEKLLYALCPQDNCADSNKVDFQKSGNVPEGTTGTMYGIMYSQMTTSPYTIITDISQVKSSKFTTNIVVTKYTP